MFSPIVTLGFILATLFGAAFHLLVGGDTRRLALFLLSSWIGFGLGHILGVLLEINLFNIGSLRMAAASIGAALALIIAHLLSANRKDQRSTR